MSETTFQSSRPLAFTGLGSLLLARSTSSWTSHSPMATRSLVRSSFPGKISMVPMASRKDDDENKNQQPQQQQQQQLRMLHHRRSLPKKVRLTRSSSTLFSSEYDDESIFYDRIIEEEGSMEDGASRKNKRTDLSRWQSFDDLLMDLENDLDSLLDDDEDADSEELDEDLGEVDFEDDDVEALLSLLGGEEEDDDDVDDYDDDEEENDENDSYNHNAGTYSNFSGNAPSLDLGLSLEEALLQGVVPATAGVGSDCLPGDWGFDPLQIAEKDYILNAQFLLLQSLPGAVKEDKPAPRPKALILRDYREAEIRHGRLAMLAAIFWPLQEMLDKLILEVDQFGPLIYGPVTLPYFPLLMTLIMMLLGYLDIYAKAIQEKDNIGDAFLPGDCFWDPLKMLEGAPNSMKRNMQERELFNGRMAMLAFAVYTFEEWTTRLPLISIRGNELLFLPAYQIPYIQEFLDEQFSNYAS